MESMRSKEDEVLKIATFVFVTSFPDHFIAKDLWNTCKQYGTVVDAFILNRRSKAVIYKARCFWERLKNSRWVLFVEEINDEETDTDEETMNESQMEKKWFYLTIDGRLGKGGTNYGLQYGGVHEKYGRDHCIARSVRSPSMNFMSFNIQGLAQKAKKDWVMKLCVNNKVNFLSLQETKIETIELFCIKRCWGNFAFDYVYSASVGNSGGILCVWDPKSFQKTNVTVSDYFVMIRGVWVPNRKKLFIISVYAPQELNVKKMLWDYISHVMSNWKGDVVVMSDFNEVRKKAERFGSVFNVQGPDAFNLFVHSNRVENGSRLVMLFYLVAKSAELAELDLVIDKGERDDDVVNKRTNVVRSLQELEKLQSLEAAQKAKIKWAIEGYENSKYYHGILNKKRSQLAIQGILVDGNWIDSPRLVKRVSAIVNGSPTEEFQFYKGLKQGDPLSIFLFILVMESLHVSFQRVVDAGMFKGITLGSLLHLSHMFYADDAIFVGTLARNMRIDGWSLEVREKSRASLGDRLIFYLPRGYSQDAWMKNGAIKVNGLAWESKVGLLTN
ncbi:RNA-directed DNA polymerase, eukaryota [Tanacetum coccineum]